MEEGDATIVMMEEGDAMMEEEGLTEDRLDKALVLLEHAEHLLPVQVWARRAELPTLIKHAMSASLAVGACGTRG